MKYKPKADTVAGRIAARWTTFEPLNIAQTSDELLLYGDIGEGWFDEGIVAKDVKAFLQGKGDVTVRINSPGGDVVEGSAIYNALSEHPGKVTIKVDGLAASIASVIAMAGDEIQMAANAVMMVHSAWTFTAGNADDMRKQAEILDTFDASILSSYTARTGRTAEDINGLLKAETWMTAEEAVAGKFADTITAAKTAPPPPEDKQEESPPAKAEAVAAIKAKIKSVCAKQTFTI